MAHTPYGYIIKDGKAMVDKIKALQVKTLLEEYVEGSSLEFAGTQAGIHRQHFPLGRMIYCIYYKGDTFYPAIISHELWHKAREERKRRADGLGRSNYFIQPAETEKTIG